MYHDQDATLKSIFDKYCKASDRAGAPEALGVLLNIAEFRMILRDSGLLGGNNKVGRPRMQGGSSLTISKHSFDV